MAFRHPVHIPYYQVDQQGVVFNMWYLGWCDDAVSAWFEWAVATHGVDLGEGFDIHLVHAEIDWILPVRWGDRVEIVVTGDRVGTTSFDLLFEVMRGDELVVRVKIVYVVIDEKTQTKKPVPEALRRVVETA